MRNEFSFLFFFNDTATTEIYTLSLHDALPISLTCLNDVLIPHLKAVFAMNYAQTMLIQFTFLDRKSTRLNSSHSQISYAVFCLKKKKQKPPPPARSNPHPPRRNMRTRPSLHPV